MKTLHYFLFLMFCLLIAGCASSSGAKDYSSSSTDSDGNKVSNIPWNKPQSWESSGQLGSAMGQ